MHTHPENQLESEIRLLFVSHDLGGGVQCHLSQLKQLLEAKAQIATLQSQPGDFTMLSLGDRRWYFHQRKHYDDLVSLLRRLKLSRVHFHHLSGFDERFWQLSEALEVPFCVTLHDFKLINGSASLSDSNGFFLQNITEQSLPEHANLPTWCMNLQQWRPLVTAFLQGAEVVFCPSQFVVDVYRGHYPRATYRQCFHPDWEQAVPYPPVKPAHGNGGILRVAVLGMLNQEKGADRLEACAMMARELGLAFEFLLFGRAYRQLDESVKPMGPYEDQDIPALLKQNAIDLVWFPARWAESYSYTLSHCLEQGLAVMAPDIGAFAERMMHRPLSFIYAYKDSTDNVLRQLSEVKQQLQSIEQPVNWSGQPGLLSRDFLYARDYLTGVRGREVMTSLDLNAFDKFLAVPRRLQPNLLKIRLLKALLKLGNWKYLSIVQKMIPYSIQKRLKRKLSHKPLHELDL
ncbi:MAG: hypothetical protein HOC23_02265 [Halieaceae bacterium]|jgi:hypothetical protein|nr:hypothetical protein [Halieaceae bacterium]